MARYKIIKAPKAQVGGLQRTQWNQSHQGIQPTKQWDHDPMRANAGVSGIQQDVANLSGGSQGRLGQMAVSTPNGVSPVDNWEGFQTGAYKYKPVQYETRRGNQVTGFKDYGTNYEQAIAENSGGKWFNDRSTPQWESNDQGIPMAASAPQYQTPVYQSQQQQGNWHTNDNADYSIDSVRTAKFGGNIPGTYNQLDTSWSGAYMGTSGQNNINGSDPNPYQVKRTLPEAAPGTGDINAEKHEQVLGDFNEDGTPALMDVSGKPHTEGGKDVNVPDGSFVFSDTKALKIKDKQILKQFGETKAKTPAAIAAKYDLQKFTALVQNPKTDKVTRDTAELMSQNYLQKLTRLASHQEQMKEMKGLSSPQEQQRYSGLQTMQSGGRPMSQVFDEQGHMSFVPDTNGPTDYQPQPSGSYPTQKKQKIAGYDPNIAYSQVFDNKTGRMSFVPDTPGPQDGGWQKPPNENIQPLDPAPQVQLPTNLQANTAPPLQGIGSIDIGTSTTDPLNNNNSQFTKPDKLAMANSLLNYAGIHKYMPWEAPVTGVIPDTVFMDPRRALAANAEQANSQANFVAQSGNGRSNLANYLALQGQAGKQAADIVGDYSNKNVAIANAANQGAAATTNSILEQQRARLKSLHQGNTIAAQQYDNSLREGRNDMLSTYNNAWKNRQGYNDLNQTSQFYQRDPNTGFMIFNDEAGKAAYMKMLNNPGTGTQHTIADWKSAYIASGGDPTRAEEYADDMYRTQSGLEHPNRTKTITGKKGTTTQTTQYQAPQQYGGLQKFMR